MSWKVILAIDPGNIQSGYVIVNRHDLKPVKFGKIDNEEVLDLLFAVSMNDIEPEIVIEMVESFGMPVGRDVFDTCVWIGRFIQFASNHDLPEPVYVTRKQEKLTLCQSMKANDATIKQYLVDRFAPGQPNYGKGTKKDPGWFYGFHADIWSAYAVAVTYADMEESK